MLNAALTDSMLVLKIFNVHSSGYIRTIDRHDDSESSPSQKSQIRIPKSALG
jgi:hypothetical protein